MIESSNKNLLNSKRKDEKTMFKKFVKDLMWTEHKYEIKGVLAEAKEELKNGKLTEDDYKTLENLAETLTEGYTYDD